MKRLTALNAILADLDEKVGPNGSKKVFAIGFFINDGVYYHFNRAVKTGLRYSVKASDCIGIQEVDSNGNAVGHVYPVWIHAISSYHSNSLKHEY